MIWRHDRAILANDSQEQKRWFWMLSGLSRPAALAAPMLQVLSWQLIAEPQSQNFTNQRNRLFMLNPVAIEFFSEDRPIDMTVHSAMELNQIRALLAVADHGGFRAAAQGLDLSQSAVSRAVARLEDGLGATLIIRRPGRRAQLTPAGRIFAEAAKRALSELQTGASEVSRLANVSAGSLRVMMTGDLTRGGRALFEAFRKMAPDVSISFREASPGKARRLLESGRADAYFAVDALLAASLEQIPLWDERLMLVVPDAHQQARQSSLPTSCLRSETLIILGARGEDYSAIIAKQFGFPIRHATHNGTFNDTLTEALFGGGVIVAPRYNVETVPSGLVAIPLRGRGSTVKRVLGWLPVSENPVTGRLIAFVRDGSVRHQISSQCLNPARQSQT